MDLRDNQFPFTLEINNKVFRFEGDTFNIPENSTIRIYFNSPDKDARLYSDCFDITKFDLEFIKVDEEGKLYASPLDFDWILSEHKDPFYVDSFLMTIKVFNKEYHANLNIIPGLLSKNEWKSMKEDLDKEINGLSLDITRKLIGVENILISSEMLRSYLIIRENYRKILGSFFEIKDKPHFSLETINGNKVINYDIPDNRLLKQIIRFYEKELNCFIDSLEDQNNEQIKYFVDNARKLKKATILVKSQDWFNKISNQKTTTLSHSFALDSSYSNLYKVYKKLNNKEEKILYNVNFPWKRSSIIYEIWCYIKICRELQKRCIESDPFLDFSSTTTIFPELSANTKMRFNFEKFWLEVIYNPSINYKKDTYPFYSLTSHVSPDILINAYSTFNGLREEEFLGSYIIECKYRRFRSYWSEYDNHNNNFGNKKTKAREQIEHYKRYMISTNLNLSPLDDNPIKRVFVTTPDPQVYQDSFKKDIFHLTLRPDAGIIDSAIDHIVDDVNEMFNKYEQMINSFK